MAMLWVFMHLSSISCWLVLFAPTQGRTVEHPVPVLSLGWARTVPAGLQALLLPKKLPSFWNATLFHFVVHKSSHPLFLWESNFQFNFLSWETGVMVFTNSFRPPGASCAAATLLSSWKVFPVIPGHISSFSELCCSASCPGPCSISGQAPVAPRRRCAGHVCGGRGE